MRNLVLGSEGFVGKPFCSYLEARGEIVDRFDVKRSGEEDARFAQLDLSQVDRVFFLALDVGGAKYLYRHEIQFRQLDWNLKLMLNVMPQLRQADVPFLFVSSQLAEEYDTVYGVTKRLGEVWTHLLPKGVRVRLWNVYGGVEEPNERSHVVSDFVFQALNTGEIHMLTTGEERRQFVHVDDASAAFHAAVSGRFTGVYDVSSFEWVCVRDIAEIIAGLTGGKVIPGKVAGSTPITPMKGRIPGWFPRVDLEAGLRKLVQDARSVFQQQLASPV